MGPQQVQAVPKGGEKGNGILDPKGSATRAEVSAILSRFCENIAG